MAQADLEPVITAFEQKDYKTAAKLVKQLMARSPDDPWVMLYAAKLQEVAKKPEAAKSLYRKVLKQTSVPKLAIQARQRLQRIEETEAAERQQAIAAAQSDPTNTGTGFLILEGIPADQRQTAAQAFARILKLDPYTARLQLPSRGWRLYRMGNMGELQVYGEELRSAGIPVFWRSLDAVRKLHVFRVQYLQDSDPNPTVICQNENGQTGALSFKWAEVAQRVKGLLPIFEDVVDLNFRREVQRKETTQDYAHVYDLHIPGRQSIVRFCDSTYDFHSGVVFNEDPNTRVRSRSMQQNWNRLSQYLDYSMPQVPLWSEFTPFAESAVNQLDLLIGFNAHLDLLRKKESTWDPAFHIYSSLAFLYEGDR